MLDRQSQAGGSFQIVEDEITSLLTDVLETDVKVVSTKTPKIEMSLNVAECKMTEKELIDEISSWLDDSDFGLEVNELVLEEN